MTPKEQTDHLKAAERVFAERMGAAAYRVHPYRNLGRPDLRKGDWLVIGVFVVEKASELRQYPVVANLVTGERRIMRDWAAATQLGLQSADETA